MRVADITLQTNYIGNNGNSLEHYLNMANKVLTQKQFTRASQNPAGANKAMKIRKRMADLDTYDTNLKNAQALFTDAETNLNHISTTCYNNISQKLISIQSTKSDVEFSAIGEEICQEAEDMVKCMNADCGERQLFAGTSNNKEPFTFKYYNCDEKGNFIYYATEDVPETAVDGNGVTCNKYTAPDGTEVLIDASIDPATGLTATANADEYEYTDVNGVTQIITLPAGVTPADLTAVTKHQYKTDADGNYIKADKDDPGAELMEAERTATLREKRAIVYYNDQDVSSIDKYYEFNGGKEGLYIDIGLGIKYKDNGDVVESTAMDISLNGAKFTGCGTDKDGDSKNLIQLAFDAAWAAYNADGEMPYGDAEKTDNMPLSDTIKGYANRLIDKLSDGQKTVLEGITELGVKQNNITFHLDKDRDYRLNLSEVQNETESIDLATEITKELAAQAAYNACLSLGATAVPQSIFNYI